MPLNVVEGCAEPGLHLFPEFTFIDKTNICSCRLSYLAGDSPHEGGEFSCDRDDSDIRILAFGNEFSVPFAQTQLNLSGDVLDNREEVFLTLLDDTGDFCRIAVSPCTFDEDPSRVAVSRFGDAPETPLTTAGVLAGNETEVRHELPGIVEAIEIANFGDDGNSDGELDTAECLKGLNDWVEAPGCGKIVKFGFEMSDRQRSRIASSSSRGT